MAARVMPRQSGSGQAPPMPFPNPVSPAQAHADAVWAAKYSTHEPFPATTLAQLNRLSGFQSVADGDYVTLRPDMQHLAPPDQQVPPSSSDALKAVLPHVPGFGWTDALASFLGNIMSAQFWIRAGEVVVGGAVLLIAVDKSLNIPVSPTSLAKKVL